MGGGEPEMDGDRRGGGLVISVDAMGGDSGPAPVIAGIQRCSRKNPDLRFLVHGRGSDLEPLVRRRRVGRVVEIVDAPEVVPMDEKPSLARRRGGETSMVSTLEALRSERADAAVSCGNTGALMVLSMLRLRKLPGVNRPAIACLWPSRNSRGFNVMLDVGADIGADASDLLQYALMGASYARNGLGIQLPRVGLLNVGTEDNKGRSELRHAQELLAEASGGQDFAYIGFVEGRDIPSDRVDVVVTDGFTGNVALKTGEGTATLIRDFLREAFKATPLSRIAAVLALTSLRRLSKRIDPRRVNGGVFLGLNGIVVKSHGAADATGVSAALSLAADLARSGFSERVARRIATAPSGAGSGRVRADDAA